MVEPDIVYHVAKYSQLGSRSEIADDYHLEGFCNCKTLEEAINTINRWYLQGGWRVFELKTLIDGVAVASSPIGSVLSED